MTSDGKIATENRKVTSFGSKDDLAHLYALRTEADAVMSGARTVNEVNADLSSGGAGFSTLRVKNGRARENLRVVVSGTASLDLSGRLFRTAGGPIVLLTTHRASKRRLRVGVHCDGPPVRASTDSRWKSNRRAALTVSLFRVH